MAAIVGTRTSPLPAGDPGGGRDRHGGQSVSSPAMSERAAAGRAYLERTQLAELMRYLGPRLDTVGTVIVGVAAAAVYLLTTLGLGLFVSTISATQQQAMMTTTFFFLIPMVYLSGFVFPIENMPVAIQWLTYVIPLRYFLVIVRAIFLKGVGLETLWPEVLELAAWGVAILTLAIARSRKRSA